VENDDVTAELEKSLFMF